MTKALALYYYSTTEQSTLNPPPNIIQFHSTPHFNHIYVANYSMHVHTLSTAAGFISAHQAKHSITFATS